MPTITPIDPIVLVTLIVPQTPHPCLNVNAHVDERKIAKHKAPLKEATALALHNAMIADETLERDLLGHQLQLDFEVEWEQYRKRADDDNLKGGPCKFMRDAIAEKLGRSDDADWVTGEISQVFPDERQGNVLIDLVAIGVYATDEPTLIDPLGQCQAMTRRSTQCSRVASSQITSDVRQVLVCDQHFNAFDRNEELRLIDLGYLVWPERKQIQYIHVS